jgi:hypothetical protein
MLAVGAGCAHEFTYVPVGPGATGGPAARYPIPPAAPQGEVYVTSFGLTEMDVAPGRRANMLHARLAVSNGSAVPWSVDGRQQMLMAPGQTPQPPAFLNTDAAGGPIYYVSPGRASVFDLYYPLPPPLDQLRYLGGFTLAWNVSAGGQVVADQTSFQGVEGMARSYGPYPPYVTVGLGFGIGWWYGPFWPYYHHPPYIRGYYYPPARVRGTAWRGAPPTAWRGTPPAATGSGSWRGTPPASTSSPLRAAPAPAPAAPRAAPHGGGWRGGGGRRR